jgi:hypothetical protein
MDLIDINVLTKSTTYNPPRVGHFRPMLYNELAENINTLLMQNVLSCLRRKYQPSSSLILHTGIEAWTI